MKAKDILFAFSLILSHFPSYSAGWIDGISLNGSTLSIHGWGCSSSQPDSFSKIQIYKAPADNFNAREILGTVIASNPRENAVGAACGSSHSNHGFSASITLSNSMLDNGAYSIEARILYQNSTSENIQTWSNRKFFFKNSSLAMPIDQTSIVARDLDSYLGGPAGHIGLYNFGHVWEVLNEGRVAFYNSWESFTLKTKVWNSLLNKVPYSGTVYTCFDPKKCYTTPAIGGVQGSGDYAIPANSHRVIRREAAPWRAYQIWASPRVVYTISPLYTPMQPEVRSRLNQAFVLKKAIVGIYRCDSFVVDALAWTVPRQNTPNNYIWHHTDKLAYGIERSLHPQWHRNFETIASRGLLSTPTSLYNDLKNSPSY